MKKITDFLEGFEKGHETLSDDMLKFLNYWWTEHILEFSKNSSLTN